ncbi:MAG: Gfo/Idh/MocA family protein [Terriglobales bacterium]|jgi:1,5-anhydro-D-fructose reductase (1,5-anhydro-D-mannitol-forming)|nr:Gfo/Idh/MocA family oxidoreductase [Terriglobales bacterium]
MVNFGIIGFGLHAVKRLMPGFELSKNCRVAALSRRDINKARESAKQHNIPNAFSSAKELCQSPAVDAVFIATPNSCHLKDVLTAIECKKPVLCEKPMAINADECRQMVEAARKANVLLGIAQVFRFNESIRRMRDRVAAGHIGPPVYARSEFCFHVGPEHPRAWINDPKVAGGGPISDVGVHCIDTLRFILQDEVVRVSAIGMSDDLSGQQESSAAITLEFSRGTLGSVFVSFRSEYGTPLEIVGPSGTLRSENSLNVDRPVHVELRHDWEVADTETFSNSMAYAYQVDSFADAVERKAEFPLPGEQGWKNQQILDAAYRSIRSGKTEEVGGIAAKRRAS